MELSLANLLLVLLAGWLAGWGATRLGYPSVLGELLIGILLGPPLLGLLHGSDALAVLAEIGILLMMLYVGMEIDPRELGRASWAGLLAALGGFITPFVLAYFTMIYFGTPPTGAVFVGIAAGVTSLTTKSRILVDLRLLDTRVAHVLMAGALVSDTISLIVFAALLGALETGALSAAGVAIVGLKVVLFFVATLLIGLRVFPYLGRKLTEIGLASRTFHFTFVLLLAVFFGELAHIAGLHAILGAFMAGLFLRDNVLGRSLSHDLMGAVREASIGFLAPIFFVTAGFQVSLGVFADNLDLLVAIVGVATVGKIAGTAAFYAFSGNGWREGLTIGAGMNGRGAVEIIVAGIALEAGLISTEVFSILVFMAIFTTATVPFLLKWGTDWLRRRGELVPAKHQRKGTVLLGAGPTARALAKALEPAEPVHLVDTNASRCQAAEKEGLRVTCGNALRDQVLGEVDAGDSGTFIAVTPNSEVNALVAQIARSTFSIGRVLLLQEGVERSGHRASLEHLNAETLFGGPISLSDWDRRIASGAVQEERIPVDREVLAGDWTRDLEPDAFLPLVVVRGEERLPFQAGELLQVGDEVVAMRHVESQAREQDLFDEIVASCPVIDLEGEITVDRLFEAAAQAFGSEIGAPPPEIVRLLRDRDRAGTTVLSPGLAIPHFRTTGEGQFHLLIMRARDGIVFPGQAEPVYAILVIASSPDQRAFHLRALAAIAQVAQAPEFERRWREAKGRVELRALIMRANRRGF